MENSQDTLSVQELPPITYPTPEDEYRQKVFVRTLAIILVPFVLASGLAGIFIVLSDSGPWHEGLLDGLVTLFISVPFAIKARSTSPTVW